MSGASSGKPKPKPKPEPKKPAGKAMAERPPGKPTVFTPAIGRRILDGLCKGMPLTILCVAEDMPGYDTVRDWAAADPLFYVALTRARNAGFDQIALDALAIADTPMEGEIITDKADGGGNRRADMLGHRRLQVETRLKLLEKWDPTRYGRKNTREVSGSAGGPVRNEGEYRPTPEDEVVIRRIVESRVRLQQSREGA